MKQIKGIKRLGYWISFFVSIPLCGQNVDPKTNVPITPAAVSPQTVPVSPNVAGTPGNVVPVLPTPSPTVSGQATAAPLPSVTAKQDAQTQQQAVVQQAAPVFGPTQTAAGAPKVGEEVKKTPVVQPAPVAQPAIPKTQEEKNEPTKAKAQKEQEQKVDEKEVKKKPPVPTEKKEKTEALPLLPAEPKVEQEKMENEEEHEAPKEEAKKAEKAPVSFEEEGIDTYEQEGGNWLLKRQALEKTMDVIEKIKDVFTKILESRIDYLVKRNKVDRTFDSFSNSIGFELGDLNQLLKTLMAQLKAERKREGDLTEEERTVLAEVESKITELKQLKSTVNSITEMDASLDDAIMQLEKEITTSNSYQTRAWKNFQTIKTVLSDEKAEELYLQTESLLKNMQDILNYLKGDLLTYFNSVINSLKEDMTKAEEAIKNLESKGINLQDEVKKIHKAKKLARKKKSQKKEDEKKKVEEKEVPIKAPIKEVKKLDGLNL